MLSKSPKPNQNSKPINKYKNFPPKTYKFLSFNQILIVFVLIRILFLYLLHIANNHTDTDYKVYTEGAYHLVHNRNPYYRHTYRYSPIMAFINIPNLYFPHFGILLFNVIDFINIFILRKCIRLNKSLSKHRVNLFVSFGAWNLLMGYISAKGSGESITVFFFFQSIYYTMKFRTEKNKTGKGKLRDLLYAAINYGILAHIRLFPVLMGLSFVLYLSKGKLITLDTIRFGVFVAAVNMFLLYLFYQLFGTIFLEEYAYYHLVRKDPRINYSLFWMRQAYQHFDYHSVSKFNMINLVTRVGIIVYSAIKFRNRLPEAIFIQIMVFTVFNTVYTNQYAIWEIMVTPLLGPKNDAGLPWERRIPLVVILASWFVILQLFEIYTKKWEEDGMQVMAELQILIVCYFSIRLVYFGFILSKIRNVAK